METTPRKTYKWQDPERPCSFNRIPPCGGCPSRTYVILNALMPFSPDWRPASQSCFVSEARSFSCKLSLHFLGCVINSLFRLYEYDFD